MRWPRLVWPTRAQIFVRMMVLDPDPIHDLFPKLLNKGLLKVRGLLVTASAHDQENSSIRDPSPIEPIQKDRKGHIPLDGPGDITADNDGVLFPPREVLQGGCPDGVIERFHYLCRTDPRKGLGLQITKQVPPVRQFRLDYFFSIVGPYLLVFHIGLPFYLFQVAINRDPEAFLRRLRSPLWAFRVERSPSRPSPSRLERPRQG